MIRDDQPDAREGQAGRRGETERSAVPLKPGNAEHPRHAAVLKLAAEKGGWGEKLPEGRGRGIAVHESFRSFVAMVADVTTKEGAIKVDRVVAAVASQAASRS